MGITKALVRVPRHDALVASRKLDPRVTQLNANGVFSISRSGSSNSGHDSLRFVKSLLAASQDGDSLASYEIFLAMRACNELMIPRAEVNAIDAAALEGCEGLLIDQSIANIKWLDRAARQGNIEAMLMYGINPRYTLGSQGAHPWSPEDVSDWKARAAGYLDQAASSGSHDALLALSSMYDEGVIVPVDPVQSYAYALAAYSALQIPQLSTLVEQHRSELSWRQEGQGRRLAEEIVRRCCINQIGD
ncbi:hypothetical protein [Stenotrophomonas bentonitica]